MLEETSEMYLIKKEAFANLSVGKKSWEKKYGLGKGPKNVPKVWSLT